MDRADNAAHIQNVGKGHLMSSTCLHNVCQKKDSFPTNYLLARFRPELVNALS